MTDEAYELSVALSTENADQVQDDLEATEEQFDNTASSLDDSAQEFQGFSQYWQGAASAIVGALAVMSAGVLARVPVIEEAAAGLSAVVDALALKVDEVFRPAIGKLNEALFSTSRAITETDDVLGDLIGTVTGVVTGAIVLAGVLAGVEFILASFASTLVGGALIGAVKSIASALISVVSGSLAAAAAFGALLGLLGVGILEKTGILDAVRNLGAAIGEALPAAVRDGMLAVLSLVLGPLAVLVSFLFLRQRGGEDDRVHGRGHLPLAPGSPGEVVHRLRLVQHHRFYLVECRVARGAERLVPDVPLYVVGGTILGLVVYKFVDGHREWVRKPGG